MNKKELEPVRPVNYSSSPSELPLTLTSSPSELIRRKSSSLEEKNIRRIDASPHQFSLSFLKLFKAPEKKAPEIIPAESDLIPVPSKPRKPKKIIQFLPLSYMKRLQKRKYIRKADRILIQFKGRELNEE